VTVDQAINRATAILPGTPAPDGELDERWQAIIEVGEFIETDPEPIWAFVSHWGCHSEWDLRAAIATCLLEHLLEHHFSRIFPRAEALALADSNFADTISQCSKFGQTEVPENARRFDALLAQLSSGGAA
jgi:hypothetical protein